MGSNPSQAQAIVVFLAGSVLLAGAFAAGGNLLLLLAAVMALAISSGIFLRCKPREDGED